MIPRLLSLLYLRLCVGQTDISDNGSPLKHSLSAWPSSLLPSKSSVTMRCKSPAPSEFFILKKEGFVFDVKKSYYLTEAEFNITKIQQSYGGYYTCESYSQGPNVTRIQPSDPLLLLVTGYLPKPSLQAYQWGTLTSGSNVTLQCLRTDSVLGPVRFALLKEGHSSPLQMSRLAGMELDFFLLNVTARDSGKYSCVYYQASPPYRASALSNPLEMAVTDATTEDYAPPDDVAKGYTMGNLIRIGVAVVIVLIMGGFLVEVWHSQRLSPNKPWPYNAPGDQ
ncbi:T-cell-interacting, activating receptor on myeloid cells protein 1 [Phodopus roborovskii]|uniref:T-cell-interacting, activating receptor on myeloid cells protein 1 n=1 Tax=Phodopus roborovskii TaxID=109678 RepID=UPI0021E4E2CA|nr:T-cell-interacting, activating receptor on myeloid cells protein 1 [Phodopus roborovskii]